MHGWGHCHSQGTIWPWMNNQRETGLTQSGGVEQVSIVAALWGTLSLHSTKPAALQQLPIPPQMLALHRIPAVADPLATPVLRQNFPGQSQPPHQHSHIKSIVCNATSCHLMPSISGTVCCSTPC
jgi:hypothetical protein